MDVDPVLVELLYKLYLIKFLRINDLPSIKYFASKVIGKSKLLLTKKNCLSAFEPNLTPQLNFSDFSLLFNNP